MKKVTTKIRDVRLCTDEDGVEAVYIDGRLRSEMGTIYMVDLAGIVGKGPCTIRHHVIALQDDGYWPNQFNKLVMVDT